MAENKELALKEKNIGNELYKAKKFQEALEHYNKAVELDSTNITFYNNRAAAYLELGQYDDCIKQCNLAVDVGKANNADFKLVVKALERMAAAYLKIDAMRKTPSFSPDSLSQHQSRIPDTLSKLSEVEKMISDSREKDRTDTEISLEEKSKGNECFRKGDYSTSIKHYSEAIRRNPADAKIYSNRAACYQKLAEFKMACDDADQCIARDPKFVKGYIRKGMALLAMKKSTEAAEAFQSALEIDEHNTDALNGYQEAIKSTVSGGEELEKSPPEANHQFFKPDNPTS